MNLSNLKIGVVAHDAGGAELLSSYIKRNKLDCKYLTEGPAKQIFTRKLGGFASVGLVEMLEQVDLILCGTSWQSSLEIDAIAEARKKKIISISFIDHWVNYRERYTRKGNMTLPDEIWVGDYLAMEKAKHEFPETTIRLVENHYLLDIKEKLIKNNLAPMGKSEKKKILYVTEPTSEHALLRYGDKLYFGYTEEEALSFFLNNIKNEADAVSSILIRPHPSENPAKYFWVSEKYSLPVMYSNNLDILDDILWSDVVVGCGSMAMVIALLASKLVMSSIPNSSQRGRLPHSEIISMYDEILNKRSRFMDRA